MNFAYSKSLMTQQSSSVMHMATGLIMIMIPVIPMMKMMTMVMI